MKKAKILLGYFAIAALLAFCVVSTLQISKLEKRIDALEKNTAGGTHLIATGR